MAELTKLDENMRKIKFSLYELCVERDLPTQGDRMYIIDGEFLLHQKLLWSRMETFEDVCQSYAQPAAIWETRNHRI